MKKKLKCIRKIWTNVSLRWILHWERNGGEQVNTCFISSTVRTGTRQFNHCSAIDSVQCSNGISTQRAFQRICWKRRINKQNKNNKNREEKKKNNKKRRGKKKIKLKAYIPHWMTDVLEAERKGSGGEDQSSWVREAHSWCSTSDLCAPALLSSWLPKEPQN